MTSIDGTTALGGAFHPPAPPFPSSLCSHLQTKGPMLGVGHRDGRPRSVGTNLTGTRSSDVERKDDVNLTQEG